MITVIYGQRGAGKSVLGLHELREQVRASGPARGVVIDTLLEGTYSGIVRVDLELLGELLEDDRTAGRMFRLAVAGEPELDQLAAVLCQDRPGRVVLLVEELSFWSSAGRTAPGLSRLIRYGRHFRVDLIGIGRRPAEISREFSSQIDRLLVFRTIEPNDLRYYAGILPAEAVEKLPQLGAHRFIEYNAAGSWSDRDPVRPA